MLQRHVGHSGLRVSRLGLGTAQWGATVDEHDAAEHLALFADAGGTLLDTAPQHGRGAAEEVVGAVLASTRLRDRLVLAGSAGLRHDGTRLVADPGRGGLLASLDRTLRTLGTGHLDLWQVHTWDAEVPLDETLSAIEQAVTSGRVRYVSLTGLTGWQTAIVHTALRSRAGALSVVGARDEYSLLRRGPERDLLPALTYLGAGLLAAAPLGRGVLTGKYRSGLPADSRAADVAEQAGVAAYLTSDAVGVVEAVARAAEGLGVTPAQVALAWTRDRPLVAATLLGIRTTAQLKEALASEDVTVPPEIVRALDDVSSPVGAPSVTV